MSTHQPLTGGGRIVAINPQTFEDVQRMAKAFVTAGVGTYSYKDTDDKRIAQATTQIMAGLELGIPPTQAMAGLMVVNGRVSAYGEMVSALLLAAGFKIEMGCRETDDGLEGFAKIVRPDGQTFSRTFTEKQAIAAGLWDTRQTVKRKGKDGSWYDAPNDSPWFRFREDMLGWKAMGRCSRAGAADVLRGLWIREDMYEPAEPRDVTPERETAAALPTIPDVPDIPDAETVDPPLADEDGFLAMLEGNVLATSTAAELYEVIEANESMVSRCSPDGQDTAREMYEAHRETLPQELEAAE